jgi:glycosyltransferase involved in cell wall biosynthesis
MLLSWIIPCYDLEPWLLRRCLQSIARATRDVSYEVIVVDDGSRRHDPAPIVAEFTEAQIHLIRQANSGPSAARNAGLDRAQGEYVGFVDADDALSAVWMPPVLALLQRERPDVLVYEAQKFHTRELPTQGAPTDTPSIARYASGAEMLTARNFPGAAWVNLFRREQQQRYAWRFPLGVFHEDGPFALRVYYDAGPTLYVSAPVYLYYQRHGSLLHTQNSPTSARHIEHRLDDFLIYIRGVHSFAAERAATATTLQQAALQRVQRQLAGDYLRSMLRLHYPPAHIEARLEGLRPLGLYPLRPAAGGWMHRALSALGNHRWGLCLLYPAEALMQHHSKL